jgi:cation diffusion facilitator CzcD-associated flavoprotein CzcO
MSDLPAYDLVIVGAGFSGLYMLHRARELGLSARVLEAGDGVGGTWYWNRYPGARCDVESMQYSYQFSAELQQEWEWTERYASQPEILGYLNHVADRFGLRRDIQFGARVRAARFDEAGGRWVITTDDAQELSARFLVMATGCLSAANIPDFPGVGSFRGRTFHTGRWPHDPVDFTSQRVGIIGTGSSAVQSIPVIARQARELVVFQRTATYAVPANNHPLSAEEQRAVKADYAGFRQRISLMNAAIGSSFPEDFSGEERLALDTEPGERARIYEERWEHGGLPFLWAFTDLYTDLQANETAAEFVRAKIRQIVTDPAVAERLTPDTVIGCKRLCVDTGYYATFNRDNVELVDVSKAPIEEITPRGLRAGGREYEFDDIVFATGFDAMTGALARIDIRGRGGLGLGDAWADGPRSYLGLGVAGFPNLFIVTGPGSPSVLTNMVVAIEQQVDWIAGCLDYLSRTGSQRIEATTPAQDEWVAHVNDVADTTVYPFCNSWYLGANIPGKPRVFLALVGYPPYVEKCDEVAAKGYAGFAISLPPARPDRQSCPSAHAGVASRC